MYSLGGHMMTDAKVQRAPARKTKSSFQEQSHQIQMASADLLREAWAARNKAAYLAPGIAIVAELSSRGGTRMESYKDTRPKQSSRQEVRFVKVVDHPDLETAVKKALAGARWTLTKNAASYVAGLYFVPNQTAFSTLEKSLEEARRNVDICNRMAAELKSQRVTSIDLFPFAVDVSDQHLARQVGLSIHDRLVALRESYSSTSQYAFTRALNECSNLETVVAGSQSTAIRLALLSAKSQRPVMIRHYGGRKGVAELERAYRGKVPDFDYGPIDQAIATFKPKS